jgi:hypothetical protein
MAVRATSGLDDFLCANFLFDGAPGEIRTPDLMVRSHALYPTELRARAANALIYVGPRAGGAELPSNQEVAAASPLDPLRRPGRTSAGRGAFAGRASYHIGPDPQCTDRPPLTRSDAASSSENRSGSRVRHCAPARRSHRRRGESRSHTYICRAAGRDSCRSRASDAPRKSGPG